MINIFLQALWYMIPAYFANMAPVFCKNNLKFLAKPVDFGKKIGGKPILGSHKTWRGLVVAVVFGIAAAYIQRVLFLDYVWAANISLFNYSNWLLFGVLMGAGAIIGDLVKSFFKRRVGKAPGKRWIPFDQLDYIVGALVFTMPLFVPQLSFVLVIFVISFFGHMIVNHIGFWLKINNAKW